jgi:hypothetical protein
MAKKDSKKKKDKKGSGAADTVDAVRSAVERALPDSSKERGGQIVDEVARAVTKVRESLEQHGVLDELGKLRAEVETLARRVTSLERPGSAAQPTTPARSTTASRSTRTRSTASKPAARKPAAKKPAAKKPAARKPAASRSTGTRARSTATRSRTSGSGS